MLRYPSTCPWRRRGPAQQSFQPAIDRGWRTPTKDPLDLCHIGDKQRRLVLPSYPRSKMDESACMEMIRSAVPRPVPTAPCANKTLAALFAEILDQSETGFQPIQVLGRIAVAVRRRNPGEVQQVGGSQRRDQSASRTSVVQVEAMPRNPVCSDAAARAAYGVHRKAVPHQCVRAMAPKKPRAARSKNRCDLRRVGHGPELSIRRGS